MRKISFAKLLKKYLGTQQKRETRYHSGSWPQLLEYIPLYFNMHIVFQIDTERGMLSSIC